MMKKLVSFICCLLPFGMGAANGADAIVVETGAGYNVGASGLNVANMHIGDTLPETPSQDDFYAGPDTAKGFTIDAVGNVTVNNLLETNKNWNFSIRGKEADAEAGTPAVFVDASFGLINANGGLDLHNIDALTVTNALTAGSGTYNSTDGVVIENAANLTLSANSITAGAITVYGGSTNTITAANNFTTGSLINYDGILKVVAGSMGRMPQPVRAAGDPVGEIQNIAGTMDISLGGELVVRNNVENSGTMIIARQPNLPTGTTVDVVVGGTMKNDSNTGTMTLNVDNLRVYGGDANNPSFVNKGTLNATISGETYLEHGFDISSMETGNTFTLVTGTLDVNNTDLILTRGTVNLTVNNGGMDFRTISNGSTMNLIAKSISVDSITNRGDLTVSTLAGGTDITIASNLTGEADSTTTITATGALEIGGNVTNAAKMDLNGNTVKIAGVANSGTSLKITAPTDTTGKIIINGDVLNEGDGELYINARDIKIDGTVTNDIANAVTTIAGSDTAGGKLQIGQMDVNAGVVNIKALAGGVTIDNDLNVTGGTLNIDGATHDFTVADVINIDGDVNVGANNVVGAGNVNIAASGPQSFVMTSTNGAITIDGNVIADASGGSARSAQFVANNITVGEDVTAENGGKLIFGDTNASGTKLTVTGNISANGKVGTGTAESVSTVEIYADDTDAASLSGDGAFVVHGSQITATGAVVDSTDNKAYGINVANSLWFGPDSSTSNPIGAPSNGMVVRDTNLLTLTAVQGGINFGGYMLVGGGKRLTMNSAADIVIGGNVYSQGTTKITANKGATFNNAINNSGEMTVTAQTIAAHDITNTGKMKLTSGAGITTGAISSSDDLTITAGTDVAAGAIEVTGGVTDVTAKTLNMALMNITGGKVNLNVADITATTTAQSQGISVAGTLMQGGDASGMLNLTQNNTVLTANNLTVGGDFLVKSNSGAYDIEDGAVDITGNLVTDAGAGATIVSKAFKSGNVTNKGSLSLTATDGANVGIIENTGTLNINGPINATQYIVNTGTTTLFGGGMSLTGKLTTTGTLYQMYNGASLSAGDINVQSDEYTFATSNLTVKNIEQKSGSMVVNTSDVSVGGDINAVDLRFVLANNPADNWMNVDVTGSVSGGVQFIGLEHMKIGDNYLFNNNSALNVAILPYAAGSGTTTANYWSTVSLNDDNTLGQITNAADGAAMIQVGGKFQSNLSLPVDSSNGGSLKNGQIGLTLRDTVDQGTAIWLVHADDGLEELGDKIRNLYVNFCNADGSLCFDYLDSLKDTNGTDGDLPAYVSVRDSDGDGNPDSLYIVFDPRFGGPVEVFKIQPIVEREVDHTTGEYVSAGALDNLIAGQLQKTGFYNRTPIEVIPVMFRGTNMEQMAKELYDRMEYYNLQRDGKGLARFSRLFQVRELEQIAGAVSLNEHTNFRSFEDRMFDEFIWNRNRNLKKAWADVDFGMFTQDVSDGKTVDGNRFNISGGFDWQESQTLILGLTGRVSHMSSENSDSMDLGYRPGEHIAGHVKTKVADTNIGLGGYLMKTLGDKTRLYGNAFLDLHWFDVSRDQNYVASIDGDGTAFSLISEWGLLHDWLNQYIVGNAYARIGYNTGFSITEKASGDDYMKLESDGYMILTPGYSLTAQKRIYPSAWFQIRPYASIGIEYDVLGAPDEVKYKFAPAHSFTDYNIEIDPLWANIGGGVELLSATGIQVGLDYRYQYNADIQLHNIKISGSYRF